MTHQVINFTVRENMKASDENRLPDDQLLGQMSYVLSQALRTVILGYVDINHRTIIFAAMDTTSGTLMRTLQLLAEHPEMQTKLRCEILEAKAAGNDLDYDQLHALPYLDAVCRETLRL